MSGIKTYTDLSQSKKLAEILPLESADMMYHSVENEYGSGAFVATSKVITNGVENDNFYIDDIPCWSLSALYDALPEIDNISPTLEKVKAEDGYCVAEPNRLYFGAHCGNPVDACYNLIMKLHELKLL